MNAPAKFVLAVITYALLAACNVSAFEATTEEKNIRFETLWRNNLWRLHRRRKFCNKKFGGLERHWDAMPNDINFAEPNANRRFNGSKKHGRIRR